MSQRTNRRRRDASKQRFPRLHANWNVFTDERVFWHVFGPLKGRRKLQNSQKNLPFHKDPPTCSLLPRVARLQVGDWSLKLIHHRQLRLKLVHTCSLPGHHVIRSGCALPHTANRTCKPFGGRRRRQRRKRGSQKTSLTLICWLRHPIVSSAADRSLVLRSFCF